MEQEFNNQGKSVSVWDIVLGAALFPKEPHFQVPIQRSHSIIERPIEFLNKVSL